MQEPWTIYILTLFPDFFEEFKQMGVVGQALRGLRAGEIRPRIETISLREYSHNKYKSVDDYPIGGGPGMIMRADVLANAFRRGVLKHAGAEDQALEWRHRFHTTLLSPQGQVWCHRTLKTHRKILLEGEQRKDWVLVCGRYEGIDQRFIENYVDSEVSIGDFIMSGGEIAALALVDSLLRTIDGVVGKKDSVKWESFEENLDGLLEGPLYTRPKVFEGLEVPPVLYSGHHKNITQYQREMALRQTEARRPDLYKKYMERKRDPVIKGVEKR